MFLQPLNVPEPPFILPCFMNVTISRTSHGAPGWFGASNGQHSSKAQTFFIGLSDPTH